LRSLPMSYSDGYGIGASGKVNPGAGCSARPESAVHESARAMPVTASLVAAEPVLVCPKGGRALCDKGEWQILDLRVAFAHPHSR
jgi:hypothetical protein